jgi:NitT/TauT family transport system permease protein/putative hydroxymethylpyrimidine transport system permease protein
VTGARVRRRLAGAIAPVLIVALLIGGWQIAADSDALSDLLGIEPFLIPAPSDIATSLWEDRSLLADNAWVTLREVLGGFAVALVLGLLAALVLHLSPILRRALYPLIVATQTVPIIVFAPIFVVWFGFGIGPKIAIIAVICFFPVTVNTLDGLGTVDGEQRRLMRSMGAGRMRTLTALELPTALPYFLSGAKIAVAIAVIGAVFGEWAGADSGLGHLMLIDNAQLEIPRLFASVVVLAGMAVALFALLSVIERRIAWWSPGRGAGTLPT